MDSDETGTDPDDTDGAGDENLSSDVNDFDTRNNELTASEMRLMLEKHNKLRRLSGSSSMQILVSQ